MTDDDQALVWYQDVDYLGGHPNRADPIRGLRFEIRPSGVYLIGKKGMWMHRPWDRIVNFIVGDETEVRANWGTKVALFGVLGLLGGTEKRAAFIVITDELGGITLKIPRIDAQRVKARCQIVKQYLPESATKPPMQPVPQVGGDAPSPGWYRNDAGESWHFDGTRWLRGPD